MNGNLEKSENIADNGGTKLAYYAYKLWQEKNDKESSNEPRFPGFEKYSNNQMFWISFAHKYCTRYEQQHVELQVMLNPHALNEFRVIGPLSNIPEFSSDFKCTLGSNMNPHEKCIIW